MSCEQLRILKCCLTCKAGYSESYDLVTIMLMVEVEMEMVEVVMMRMMIKKRRIRC